MIRRAVGSRPTCRCATAMSEHAMGMDANGLSAKGMGLAGRVDKWESVKDVPSECLIFSWGRWEGPLGN